MSRKKKEEKTLTVEERLEQEKKHGLREIEEILDHVNEPTYHFNIGDKVLFGGMKESIVDEIFHDGKVYGLKCVLTKNNYGHPYDVETYRVRAWTDIRPIKLGNTEFARNQNVKLYFQNGTIESLIFKYYHFGIDMDPDYQRDYIWDIKDKELLIDSIFNNIDIGKFVLVCKDDWIESNLHYEILDGKQRLSTLIEFYENRFPYKGKYYNELSGKDKYVFKEHMIATAEVNNVEKKDVLNYFLLLNRSGRVMEQSQLDKVEKMMNQLNLGEKNEKEE